MEYFVQICKRENKPLKRINVCVTLIRFLILFIFLLRRVFTALQSFSTVMFVANYLLLFFYNFARTRVRLPSIFI